MQLTGQNSNMRLPQGGSTVDWVGLFQPLPGLAATPAQNRTRRKGTERARPKREAASSGQSSPNGQAGAGSPVPAALLTWRLSGPGVGCHVLPLPPTSAHVAHAAWTTWQPSQLCPCVHIRFSNQPYCSVCYFLLLPPSRTQTPPNLLLLLSPP